MEINVDCRDTDRVALHCNRACINTYNIILLCVCARSYETNCNEGSFDYY